MVRECQVKGCKHPAGKGFRFCGIHILRRRGGKPFLTPTEIPVQEEE